MNNETSNATVETEVRELVDLWAQAVRSMDIDAIASHYAPDILAFDAIAALRFKGRDAYRRHWEACLAFCPKGGMIFDMKTMKVLDLKP